MKAFDVIGAIKEDSSEDSYSVKRIQFKVEQKIQIPIVINTKVQIQSISHQMRKPKFHLVKTKQPPIHIINSKKNSTLGLDTENQTWTTGTPFVAPTLKGFFGMLRGSDRNQMTLQNNQPSAQRKWFHPLEIFSQRIDNSQPVDIPQNPPYHQQRIMQQAIEIKATVKKGIPKSFNDNFNQKQRIPDKSHSQKSFNQSLQRQQIIYHANIIESQVKEVHLNDLPQTHKQDEQQEFTFSKRIANLFVSLTEKFGNQNNPPVEKSESIVQIESKISSSQNNPPVEKSESSVQSQREISSSQNNSPAEKSESIVQIESERSSQKITRENKIAESSVQQYNVKHFRQTQSKRISFEESVVVTHF